MFSMITLVAGFSAAGAAEIKEYLKTVILELKVKGFWRYIEPGTRGWLELASKLKDIRFKSKKVLSVLVKILKRLKPLIKLPNLLSWIGARYAWRSGKLASGWGNKQAEKWKDDRAYQFYCGLTALQLSRIIPGMTIPELEIIRDLLNLRGFIRVLASLRRIM